MSTGVLTDPTDRDQRAHQALNADPELGVTEHPLSTGTGSPHVSLAGYSGSLDALLDLARAERINLAGLSFVDLLDQLLGAMEQSGALLAKAGWVVVMATIVALRSRLLLPADAPERREAAEEAGRLCDRLAELQRMQALAAWLQARPQLGREVFGRGAPEWLGVAVEAPGQFDIIEFLWAAVSVFDDEAVETATVYRPVVLELFSVREAQERISRLLADMPDGCNLEQLLPVVDGDNAPVRARRQRSAWSSTFSAALELAKLGEIVLDQTAGADDVYARYAMTNLPTPICRYSAVSPGYDPPS